MSTTDFKRGQVSRRAGPVSGNDIDTDRIVPTRFLKALAFEGVGEPAIETRRRSCATSRGSDW